MVLSSSHVCPIRVKDVRVNLKFDEFSSDRDSHDSGFEEYLGYPIESPPCEVMLLNPLVSSWYCTQ